MYSYNKLNRAVRLALLVSATTAGSITGRSPTKR